MARKRKPSTSLYLETIRDARASADGTVPIPKVRRDEDWWALTPNTPASPAPDTPDTPVRPSVRHAQEALMARIIRTLMED